MINVSFKKGILMTAFAGMLMVASLEARATIVGRVASAEDHEGLPGVQITYMLPDSTIAGRTSTDTEGHFIIDSHVIKDATITLSLTGYTGSVVTIGHDANDENIGDIYITPISTRLGEVTVEGERVLAKSNKFIVYPEESMLRTAPSVTDVLANMTLPGLLVSPFGNAVTIYGKNVIYKVDGIVRQPQDVMALNPTSIMRIDYFDRPTGRYMDNDTGGIIEITLKPRLSGGSLFEQVEEGAPVIDGYNITALTYNNRRSQFRLNYRLDWLRDNNGIWEETTHYLNKNRPATQHKFSDHNSWHEYANEIRASYTLDMDHDAALDITSTMKWDNEIRHRPAITTTTASPETPEEKYIESQRDHAVTTDFGAGISYTRNISTPERTFNAKIEYFSSVEKTKNFIKQPDEIFNNTAKSTPQVVRAETEWNFPAGKVNMNAGISEIYLFSDVTHKSTTFQRSSLHNNTLYSYIGVNGKIGSKWTYDAIGAVKYYSFRGSGRRSDDVFPKGQLDITYIPSSGFRITAEASYTQVLTSIYDRADYFTITDGLNAECGNPNLKNAQVASFCIMPSFYKGPWGITSFGTIERYRNARASNVRFEDPYYVKQLINMRHWDWIIGNIQLSYNLKPHRNMSIRFYGEYDMRHSLAQMPEGPSVKATHISERLGSSFNCNAWSAMVEWRSKSYSSDGYEHGEGPAMLLLKASYSYRNIILGVRGTFDLKKDRISKTFYRNAAIDRESWNGIQNGESRISLNFTYKLSFGRRGDGRDPQLTFDADKL